MLSVPHTPICFLSVFFFFFCFIFSVYVFVFSTSLFFCVFYYPSLVVVYCARLRPFYTVCCDKIYHFTLQLLLAYYGCPSWTTYWFAGCPTTTTTLRWPHHASFPEKSCFVLFSCFSWHSHLNKGWVSLLLTSIACT